MTDSHDSTSPVGTAIDSSVPHSARVWNYWLGGKDNYPVDREVGDDFTRLYPEIIVVARSSRAFLKRAIVHLTAEAGLRQFLDVGTGMPTAENTHQVAQLVAPDARIVYVDNDPLVLRHAQALLTSTPEGVTDYIDADLHEPERILEMAAKTLDFDRPVALMLMGILGHIQDYDEAVSIVRRLQQALPSGSYFVHYDSTDTDQALKEAQQGYDDTGAVPYVLRGLEQISRFYDGLELVEPGIVSCPLWRPGPSETPIGTTDVHGGVARKP